MADVLTDQINAALSAVGSQLSIPAADPAPPREAPPLVALVDAIGDEPALEVPETAIERLEPAPWEQRFAPLEARLQQVVTKDELDALATRLTGDTQRQLTTLVEALRPQTTVPPGTPPVAEEPISLAEATSQLYFNNDRTMLDAYERQQQQRERDRERATSLQAHRREVITALTGKYPDLATGAGVQALLPEYNAILQDPITRATLSPDPRYLMDYNGQTVDLRVIAQAAKLRAERQEAVAQTQASQAQATTERQQTERVQQAPGVGGGAATQQRPVETPKHLLPGNIYKGSDPLLDHPGMQKALENANWGKTKEAQAKHLAEKLKPEVKARLALQYRQGRHDEVGSI